MSKIIIKKQPKKISPVALSFKYGAIFLLLTLSIVIAACGANTGSATITSASTSTSTTTPSKATPTINFSKINQSSPTPALPKQWCGVWVTNESPPISGGSLPIYAKFETQQDGNPVGIANAAVTISIAWGDLSGTVPLPTVITTSDGLAVAYASTAGHPLALNKLSLITANFSSGSVTCSVGMDRPASFVIVAGAKATPTKINK